MFQKLTNAGERIADVAVKRQIERLAGTPAPSGIRADAIDGGIALTGKGLRRRYIADPSLRNFGR